MGDILAVLIVGMTIVGFCSVIVAVSWIGHVRQRQRETERMYQYITGQCTASRAPRTSRQTRYTHKELAAKIHETEMAALREMTNMPQFDEIDASEVIKQFEEMVNKGR